MKIIKKFKNLLLIYTFILTCIIVTSSNLYATNRALWVWSMSWDLIRDISGHDNADLFSFIEAPHGNANANIDILYMSFHETDVQNYPDLIARFIADAHSRGKDVHFLTGAKHWALTESHQEAIDVLNLVLNYNASRTQMCERFDGIQFDIEPHTLSEWDTQHQSIWTQFMTLLSNMQDMITTHNATYNDNLINGVAIPRWLDGYIDSTSGKAYHKLIQDIVDYIAIMNYSSASWSVGDSSAEIAYADSIDKPGSVYVGYETMAVTWPEGVWLTDTHKDTMYLHRQSFWIDGNNYLETRCAEVEALFASIPSYGGLALHYYEDIRNGNFAYRTLGFDNNNHAPVAFIDNPNGNEKFFYSTPQDVIYRVYDQDNDAVSVTIEARINNSSTWTPIVTDQQITSTSPNTDNTLSTHHFIWDITTTWTQNVVFPDSASQAVCEMRITVTDAQGLSSVEQSDYQFFITSEIFSSQLPTVTGAVPSVVEPQYPTDGFLLSWDGCFNIPAGETPVYYYSLHGHTHPDKAFRTRATHGYIPIDQSGVATVTIWAKTQAGVSLPISIAVTVYPDIDGDGAADQIDSDKDGDGVSNDDEYNAITGSCDQSSYPSSLRVALYEMDGNYNNHMQNKPSLSINSSFYKSFQQGLFGYTNDTCVRMTSPSITSQSSNRIKTANDITPNEITALTCEMWIKPNPTSGYNFIPLIFAGDINEGISLFLKDNTNYLTLRYYYTPASNTSQGAGGTPGCFVPLYYPNTGLLDGNWHHVAFTFNGLDHTMTLYIDGQRAGYTQNNTLVPFNSSRPMQFFDATSTYDASNTYYQSYDGDNTAQFYSLPYLDTISCQYLGDFDDIRITLAAVPREQLGYFIHPKPSGTDSDDDSISDMDEQLVYFTDPYKTDSDNDGLDDDYELSTTQTDPARADSDEDSQRDSYELAKGSNPRNRASFYLATDFIGMTQTPVPSAVIIWEGGNNGNYNIFWRDSSSDTWNRIDGNALNFITEDPDNHIFSWTDTGEDPDMTTGAPNSTGVTYREYKVVYPVE